MLPIGGYGLLARYGAALLLLAICAGGLWKCGRDSERTAHDATKAKHAAVLASLADKAREAADKADRASIRVREERAAIDARHQEELTHAQVEADRLRADLRSGRIRLQERWACPVPRAGQGGDSAGTGAADPASRFDSAGRIVGAADQDAAVIDWLWESWMADRKAGIDGGCMVVQ